MFWVSSVAYIYAYAFNRNWNSGGGEAGAYACVVPKYAYEISWVKLFDFF